MVQCKITRIQIIQFCIIICCNMIASHKFAISKVFIEITSQRKSKDSVISLMSIDASREQKLENWKA